MSYDVKYIGYIELDIADIARERDERRRSC